MSKSIVIGLLGASAILLAILLTGCSDAPSPTPSALAVPTPTVTAQPGVTQAPTPTLAPTDTLTPEPTPATATLSLDVYLTLCASTEEELADDATYGELSSVLAAEADRFEALTPPAQLSEWHLLNIEAYRTAQAGVDTQPKDDVMVDNPTINAVGDDFVEKLREAAARVPKDVLQQMIEAHCIDPDSVPDDYADVPDGQGNDIDSATVAAATLSLDVYLTLCASTEEELADDATFGDLSSQFAAEVDRLEALTPPAQLSEWHLLNIENYRTIQAVFDLHPKDDVVDFANLLIIGGAAVELEEKLGEVAARLPEDVLQQMIEAGCIDPDLVPDDYEDVPDDHGNSEGDATAIRVGADVRGALDYDGDIDYFRFQAEQGEFYQIDVALGTLDDSIVSLYDSDGWFLDSNDYYEGAYASRLYWEAPSSGERYVAVEGYGIGTYTLTVSISDLIDDHANSEGGATAIRVGADVRGALDYDDDIDFFRFQAERGQSYRIDVALGTLDDSIVDLYDADGSYLDACYDYGDTYASRLFWEAPSSGERYVAVYGYGTGTYTLTVSSFGDHGDDFESATRIAIGEAVAIEIESLDDMDVLVFLARPGTDYVVTLDWETYQIWDNPGSIMALYDAGGRLLARLNDYDFSAQRIRNKIMWQAVTGGDYYIVVGDENTLGTFALTVTGGEATEQLDGDDQSDTPGNATNAGNTSYDTDGDGLIEVSALMQLNAIRWDLDGDGSPSSNATGYNAAFPNAIAGMGCPDSGCSGYELISDLDFDTNGNGRADAGDDYWNDGEGWLPIGDDINNAAFKTFFNGGGHTISNLYIDRRDARYIGLFGVTWFDGINWVGLNNNIRDLALVNVDVQGGLHTGGLAGANRIVIVACSVTGVVNGDIKVGGLVGNNSSGTVIASYSTASVGYAEGGFGEGGFGGLVGSNFFGTIIASYSIGSVTSDFGEVGGLVGSNFTDRGTATDSYWDTQTSGQSESAGGEGKTTSELQSPTGYTGIYENWNMDLERTELMTTSGTSARLTNTQR